MSEKWYEYQPKEFGLSGKYHPVYLPVEKIIKGFVKGKKVLDVGCNAGMASLLASKHGAEKATGLDRKDKILSQAHQVLEKWRELDIISPNEKVDFVKGDICRNIDLLDEHDFIFFIRVLYHIRDNPEEGRSASREEAGIKMLEAKLKNRKDVILFLQANRARNYLFDPSKGNYGNNLAGIDGLKRLLTGWNLDPLVYNDEIVIGIHPEHAEYETIKNFLENIR